MFQLITSPRYNLIHKFIVRALTSLVFESLARCPWSRSLYESKAQPQCRGFQNIRNFTEPRLPDWFATVNNIFLFFSLKNNITFCQAKKWKNFFSIVWKYEFLNFKWQKYVSYYYYLLLLFVIITIIIIIILSLF